MQTLIQCLKTTHKTNMNNKKYNITSVLSNGHGIQDFVPIGTQMINDWGKTVTVVGYQLWDADPQETEPYGC
jgi:hypothetical protein